MTYYSKFDGEEVAGKVYNFGDPIDDDAPANVLILLRETGRITAVPPTAGVSIPPPEMKLADMSHAQLVTTASTLVITALQGEDRDALISGIERMREKAQRDGTTEPASVDPDADADAYAAIKDKDPTTLRTAELELVARVEAVEFGDDVKNNGDRAKAIADARASRKPPADPAS